jgi:hypothetical protein
MTDPVAQFLGAIRGAGLSMPPRIIPDGRLHRFASNGYARDDSGWYVFHADGVPAGGFGCLRSGLSETWRADIGRRLSPPSPLKIFAPICRRTPRFLSLTGACGLRAASIPGSFR